MAELFARSILPQTISQAHGGWFQLVESKGDLNPNESTVLSKYAAWLRTVETTSLNKCYKMVVLRVLIDHGRLFEPIELGRFSGLCRRFMLEHPVLQRDLTEGNHEIDHRNASEEQWASWWRRWPIDRWLDIQNRERWFELQNDLFRLTVDCPVDLRPTFEAMTEELVEWRLAAYSKSHRLIPQVDAEVSFEAKVSHASGRAILFLPEVTKVPERPVGLIDVRLPDGNHWEFKFVKVACNVASPPGAKENQLSSLLRGWYGQNAGLPGTDYRVVFTRTAGQWSIRPLSTVVETPTALSIPELLSLPNEPMILPSVARRARYTTHVPVYDVVAKAGDWGPDGVPSEIGWMKVQRHKLSKGMFAARVVGESMEPKIPSGSWCLFRPCPAGTRQNRLLLVQLNSFVDPVDGGRYTVKKYRSEIEQIEDSWQHKSITLAPLNPKFEPIHIGAEDADDMRVIGEFVCIIEA
ncbi:MAG: hypothetical protein JNK57_10890 [Planctomycetaceae bacterium]|nr:hypothetical protein [Planctomycetaceae bacterium]